MSNPIELDFSHIAKGFTAEELSSLYNRGWSVAGQVMLKGDFTDDKPGATEELIPVNIWARHTGAMLGAQVASALIDAYKIYVKQNDQYDPADVLEYLAKSFFGISIQDVTTNMEREDEPAEEPEL